MMMRKRKLTTQQIEEETPVGFKWVIGFIIYNILGGGLIITYGDVLDVTTSPP